MITRVTRRAILTALATLTLAGCGPQTHQSPGDLSVLAKGPDQRALSVPPPHVAAALDAVGGLAVWMQCRQLMCDAVVTANQPDGGFYLTVHKFDVYPWGNAIQVSAREPQTPLVFRVVAGQYSLLEGQVSLDVSPLSVSYRDYADAAFQILTAPARLLMDNATLLRKPMPVMMAGAWYHPIEATFQAGQVAPGGTGGQNATAVEPYWTQGIYFQRQDGSVIDIIWLGNPAAKRFVLVRGYNYARTAEDGVLVPMKIEVFQSDAEAAQGRRLVLVDLKQ